MVLYYIMALLWNLLTFYLSSSHSSYILHKKVINAFAKSEFPSKAVEAESIIQSMLDLYHSGNLQEQPSIITYLDIINAYAYTKGNLGDRRSAL